PIRRLLPPARITPLTRTIYATAGMIHRPLYPAPDSPAITPHADARSQASCRCYSATTPRLIYASSDLFGRHRAPDGCWPPWRGSVLELLPCGDDGPCPKHDGRGAGEIQQGRGRPAGGRTAVKDEVDAGAEARHDLIGGARARGPVGIRARRRD